MKHEPTAAERWARALQIGYRRPVRGAALVCAATVWRRALGKEQTT